MCLQLTWQVLDLSCCRGVGDAGLAAVAAAGARLHTLNLSSCHQLTDAAFAALGARCGALAHLNACGCELLGDAGLAALAAGARCSPCGSCVAVSMMNVCCPCCAGRVLQRIPGIPWHC